MEVGTPRFSAAISVLVMFLIWSIQVIESHLPCKLLPLSTGPTVFSVNSSKVADNKSPVVRIHNHLVATRARRYDAQDWWRGTASNTAFAVGIWAV